jgi:lipopolysaccharide export system protein LptA
MSAARISLLLGAALLGTTAFAQSNMQGVPNAVQGFSVNRDQPIQIEATSLEVRDKESIATFRGNVHVIQGDTHMRSQTLKVLYDQQRGNKAAGPARTVSAAPPGPAGQQEIQRLEAGGGVVVTQKDQKATGDSGIFDTKSNSVTLIGNVVVSQGQSMLRGERLIVNLETGVSRMESTGRVSGTFSSPPQQAAPQQQQPPGRPTSLAPKPKVN